LKAYAFNRCAPAEGVMQKFWMVCSFYGIDQQETSRADFNVIPNPNNGQMTLSFEHLTGRIDVKVYDMKGVLLDNFQTYNSLPENTMPYQFQRSTQGIYFFVATGREGTVSKKVIVK
jgi:hypothetical protein